MNRRNLVRVQLLVLALLVLLVLIRMVVGPPKPDGLLVFIDMEPFELWHGAIELEQAGSVSVTAVGAFEQENGVDTSPGLAAYGWIVRRDDREVVWTMDAEHVERGRGSVALVPGDTLALDAGVYDVYFSTQGGTFGSERKRGRWRHEAEQWQLVVDLVGVTTPARLVQEPHSAYRLDKVADGTGSPIWTSGPVRSDEQVEYLFEVQRPTRLTVYAVGEIDTEPLDYGWIEDVTTKERVWEMTASNTEQAGGLERNRRFFGELSLNEGTYRAVFQTNGHHAYRDWWGHPPTDPAGWGLTLVSADPHTVAPFDPWAVREPLVEMTQVADAEERVQRFQVTQLLDVIIYSMGEITGDGRWDFGELLKEEPHQKKTVWRMSREASFHAGGGDKNRVEVAFLRLEPGIYTLRYVTDRSHAFDDWNDDPPHYPNRWGVTLFPLAASYDPAVFSLLPDAELPPAQTPTPSLGEVEGEPLVTWTRLQEDEDRRQEFELEEVTELHIIALGEISRSDRHDYGWIERADTGERVWEMTRENTHAVGESRNRRFDGIVALPAGQYVARFVTDFSHHYGDFNGDVPEEAERWGMTVYILNAPGI